MTTTTVKPANGLRKLANNEALGLAFVEWKTPEDETALNDFADFLTEQIAKVAQYDVEHDSLFLQNLAGIPAVDWARRRIHIFPVFIEKLVICETVTPNVDGLELRIERQGEWHLTLSALTNCRAHVQAWDAFIARSSALALGGGLCVNTLELPKSSLKSGDVDLRPLVLHALRPDGGATDRGRTTQQKAVANSFWQTFWATGALRSQRGLVFPVAFMPIDRSWQGEFFPPFNERCISENQKIYGRTAILAYINEKLTTDKALLFDAEQCKFGISANFDADAEGICPSDVALAMYELNRTAFVDAYIGENKNLFETWRTQEEALPRGQAFNATGIEAAPVMSASDESVHVIRRIVPFAGAAYLSQVMHETERLIEDGKIQDLDGEIVAATNSTFFLNFPEEYCNIHSAMNDPASILVENGKTRQAKALKRAVFALSEDGEALITTDGCNTLFCNADSAPQLRVNAFTNANKCGGENVINSTFGAVIVGDAVVETFCGNTEVPSNGIIYGWDALPQTTIDPEKAAKAKIKSADGTHEMTVRHAFAVGPMLLRNSTPVPFGTSGEEFVPIHLRYPMSAEETADLPRATMPEALRECVAKGTPPTRFPHDWNKTRAPRTALGVKSDGTVVLAVVDGRADLPHSIGVTLAELAQIMLNLGCCEAMNMDGGGSSVMFINDASAAEHKLRPEIHNGVVNLPSDAGGVERMLPVPLVLVRRTSGAK